MLRGASNSMASAAKHVPIPKNGVDYRGKVVLAPMVRSGELPSRLMALKYGADLVWGPETVDRAMIGTNVRQNPRTSAIEFSRTPSNGGRKNVDKPPSESVIYRIQPSLESSRLIFQIGTANPSYAVQAATMVAPYVSGIDVNAGCPKPFSTSGGMGAALLTTPELLCEILSRLVAEVGQTFEIGISVKIRLLSTEDETRSMVEKLCQTGITGLTVHCRTRSMRKTEKAIREQLKMVGQVCREAGVACLMNGDVDDRAQAEMLAEEYEVDGGMIASAAEKNPSVFRSREQGGAASWQEVVDHYMEAAIGVENRWGNTKFLLAQIVPGKEQVSKGLSKAKNYEHVCAMFQLEHLTQKAKELDSLLGLDERITRSEQKAQKRSSMAPSSENDVNKGVSKRLKYNPHSDYNKNEATSVMQDQHISAPAKEDVPQPAICT